MNNSIEIHDLGKCYRQYPSRKERLKEWLFPFLGKRHAEKWVLRHIDLEIRQGEAVGIVGMNGAGKSTLLKILTGTTQQTCGTVALHGSVAALLELGLGFHPDFTGRQNVYMSGQLLGYTLEEIADCMAQVEAFADIGDAIDAPVRTYSSGMQVRLAFSVATMKRPDILIVDEALSVGDAYFQHKSFGRIKSFCDAGTTLLLVSHDVAAIQAVCNRAVLLDHGKVLRMGAPEEIMNYYNAMLSDSNTPIQEEMLAEGHTKIVSGDGAVRLTSIRLCNEKNNAAEIFSVGETITILIKAEVARNIPLLNCGFAIKDRIGQTHYGTNTSMNGKTLYDLKAGDIVYWKSRLIMNIGEGHYSISVAFVGDEKTHINKNYEWTDYAAVFQIINMQSYPFIGCSYLPCVMDVCV